MDNKFLAIGLCLLFLACFVQVASAGEIYLYGTIRSDPNDQREYGKPYYQFTLRVESSSENLTTYPYNATLLVDVDLYKLYNYSWVVDSKLNVTGVYIADQPQTWSPPIGYFLVTSMVMDNATQSTGWVATLNQLISAISSIGKLLITLVVQVVFQLCGYQAPEWVVAGIIVLSAFSFLIKYFHKLPWFVVFVGVVLCISIVAYMLTGFHL